MSTSARHAVGCRALELLGVALPYGVEVAQRQLVQRGVPGEVGQALSLRPVAGHPGVHPGQPRVMVAGLVVGVGPRVGGMPCRRIRRQRRARQVHRFVVVPLLLADEREQAEEPRVVAVRRRCALDDRPRLCGHLGHAGEGNRGHGHGQQHRVARIGGQVREQRPVIALEVPVDGVDVAALSLARPAGESAGVVEPGRDVDVDAHLVPEQRQVRVREGEGGVVGERGRDPHVGIAAEPEQVADAGDVRLRGHGARGQRIAVVVATTHGCSVSRATEIVDDLGARVCRSPCPGPLVGAGP